MSASEHSGGFASEGSDSGNSSQGDSSQSDSGNSSQGDSSQSDGSSDGSGDSSQSDGSSDNSNSESSDQSADSSKDSNDSSNNSSDSSNNSNDSSENSSNESSENSSDNSSESSNDSKSRTSGENNNPVVSATVIGLTAAGLAAVFWQAAHRAMRPPPVNQPTPEDQPSPEEVGEAAQTYLRGRTHQLREDLALGAGPAIEDLASLAQIRREHLGTFGRLLRAHRKELLELADARRLTPERALAWLQRVGEIARTDPKLDEDRRAFLSRYARGEPSP